jgi:hypothetical protein
MKLKICLLLIALANLWSARAQAPQFPPLLVVTEKDENLTVKWDNGTPVDAQIERLDGPTEKWHVTLPGFSFFPGGTYYLAEPPGEGGVNVITVAGLQPPFFEGPNDFTWESDVILSQPVDAPASNGFAGQNFVLPILVLLLDEPDTVVPDAGSTFALAGLALVGVGAMRKRCVK